MCSAIQPSSRAMFEAIRSAKHFFQQRIAAVARAERPDLARLRENGRCIFPGCRARARPSRPGPAARRRSACTAPRASPLSISAKTGRPMRAMMRMFTTTYGESVSWTPICDMRRADRPHAERQHVHRPAAHRAVEQLLQLPAHLEGVDPVVRRPGVVLGERADEGAVLDPRDVARIRSRVVAARPKLLVQLG